MSFAVFGQNFPKFSDLDPPKFSRLRRAQKRKTSLFRLENPQIFAPAARSETKKLIVSPGNIHFFAPAAHSETGNSSPPAVLISASKNCKSHRTSPPSEVRISMLKNCKSHRPSPPPSVRISISKTVKVIVPSPPQAIFFHISASKNCKSHRPKPAAGDFFSDFGFEKL